MASPIEVQPHAFPDTLAVGKKAQLVLCVTNINPSSTGKLTVEDDFRFTFHPMFAGSLGLAGPPLVTSATLTPGDFGVGFDPTTRTAHIHNLKKNAVFAPGDVVSVAVTFMAPSAAGVGTILVQGPYQAGRINSPAPAFLSVAFVNLPGGSGGGSVGPPGPTGHAGPTGPAGATGSQGPQGLIGPQGPQGVQGIQGVQGVQGLQGQKGDKGDIGPPGATGPRGLPGEAAGADLLRWYEASGLHVDPIGGTRPRGVVRDGQVLWVTRPGESRIAEVDGSDGRILAEHDVGGRPSGLALVPGDNWNPATLWIANKGDPAVPGSSKLQIFDTVSSSLIPIVPNAGPFTGWCDVLYDSSSQLVAATAYSPGMFVLFDASPGNFPSTRGVLSIGAGAAGIYCDGTYWFVTCESTQEIVKIGMVPNVHGVSVLQVLARLQFTQANPRTWPPLA